MARALVLKEGGTALGVEYFSEERVQQTQINSCTRIRVRRAHVFVGMLFPNAEVRADNRTDQCAGFGSPYHSIKGRLVNIRLAESCCRIGSEQPQNSGIQKGTP